LTKATNSWFASKVTCSLSADWVAQQIVKLAKADFRTIIVTVNPLTFVTIPLKEFFVSTYFKLFSHKSKDAIESGSVAEVSVNK
jgi:phosphoglycolate phosphatase-like HAD superfamily hydrolase